MIDTVVIGAGVSGLRAASRLHQAGRDVVVLEARDRVGGRLASGDVDGARLDLGATWFWANEARITSLIEDDGIEVFAQHLDGDALLQTGDGVTRADGNPIDVQSGRFADGATAITDALAARLPDGAIELGQAVESIRVGIDGVVVETSTTSFTATSVVLAIPPALAVHLIDFEPALPERIEALAKVTPVWMGGMRKVVAVYDQPFWRDDGLAGSAMSYVGPLREVHDMSAASGSPGALFGFSPADPRGATLSADAVLRQLVDLFGAEAGRPKQLTITDWSLEPFTSPPGAATMQMYQTYGHPLFAEALFDGAVVWAATETSAVNPGHIDGALAAGDRAADLLLGEPAARSGPAEWTSSRT